MPSKSKFLRAQDGAVIPVFAMLLVAILGIAGGAIDIGRAHAAKDELQHALDAAVLAIAGSAADDRIERGKAAFKSNVSTNALLTLQPAFSIEPDGTVAGTISGPIPSTLLKVIGINVMSVDLKSIAASNAGEKITMTFTPISAKGIFDKEISLFVRDASGSIVSLTPVVDYDYRGGPSSLTNVNNQPSVTITVEKGSTYGLMMRVWDDQSYQGNRNVAPYDYYSDINTSLITTSGTCESGQRNNWEDGGDGDYADFVYDVACSSIPNINTENVRLVE